MKRCLLSYLGEAIVLEVVFDELGEQYCNDVDDPYCPFLNNRFSD